MHEYHDILEHIMMNGTSKTDRTGTGTKSVFGIHNVYDLNKGFPILTTKKVNFRSVVSELLWFLEGSTDERRLAELHYGKPREELIDKTTIWTANALKQGKDLGYSQNDMIRLLGPVYGSQWRNWYSKSSVIENLPEQKVNKISNPVNTYTGPKTVYYDVAMLIWKDWILDNCPNEKWADFRNFFFDMDKIPGFYDCYRQGYFSMNKINYGKLSFSSPTDQNYSTVKYTYSNSVTGERFATFIKDDPLSDMPDWNVTIEHGHFGYRTTVDQIRVILDKLKNDPDNRRIILNAWNVTELDSMALPPCHSMMQFYVNDGKLSGQLYQRSADVPLGVPFNIASYSLLIHLFARELGYQVGEFNHVLGDAHIYNNQIDGCAEQLTRKPYALPKLKIDDDFDLMQGLNHGFDLNDASKFHLIDYKHHDTIKFPFST